MIVDGNLADNMADIAGYIDQLNGEEQDGPLVQVAAELAATEEPSQQQELYFTLAEGSAGLLKGPLNDLEASYNLLLFVLSQAPDFGTLMPVILANLASDIPESSAQQLVILAILGNLFNIMPRNSRFRFDVFNKIVDFSIAAGTLGQLVPQLSQLPEWLAEWNATEDNKTDIYNKLVNSLNTLSPKATYQLLLAASKANAAGDITEQLVTDVLANTHIYDFDEVLAVPAVQQLPKTNSDLYATLKAVSIGDYDAFKSLPAASNPQIQSKARVVALAKIAGTKRAVSYAQISAATGVEASRVEILVIDAIKAGLIKGRMDQFKQELLVEQVTPVGEFTNAHWEEIEKRLGAWKESLSNVLAISKSARDNSDRVANLSKALRA